jgi:hypothetical protein
MTMVTASTAITDPASGPPISAATGAELTTISNARRLLETRLTVATVGARFSGSLERTRSTLIPRSASVTRIDCTVSAIA